MKRQASFKEYTVTIADSGSAEVSKLFKNTLNGLQELCEANNLACPKGYGAGMLGKKIIKEQNGGNESATSALIGQYIISREPNDSIKVCKIFKNTVGTLRELSELVGFKYEDKWNTQTFGNKVIDAIESGEFAKLAKAKKAEEAVAIEVAEDTTAVADAPQAVAQEIPADAVLLEPKDPTEIGEWEFKNKDFKSVVIPEGVTEIRNSAFWGCTALESVVIPNSVTEIGGDAFKGCTALESVVIPNSVTEIGEDAFKGCTALESVVIPEGVTEIRNSAFSGCTALESVVIPDSVTEIGSYAFLDCTALESVVIPNSVTEIRNSAFDGCDNLTIECGDAFVKQDGIIYNSDKTKLVYVANPIDVVLPDTLSLTELSLRKFAYNKTLKSVVIPEGVTEIGFSAFSDCTALESVVIPEGVLTINEFTFYGCSNLKKVTLQEGLKKIEKWAFEDCSELYEINIPESVTQIRKDAFKGCKKLNVKSIFDTLNKRKKGSGNSQSSQIENPNFTFEDYENMGCPEDLEIPESYTSIADNALKGCSDLESLVIPEGVTHIGEFAFYDCYSLRSVTLPNTLNTCGDFAFDAEDMEDIERDYEIDELKNNGGVIYNSDYTNILFVDGPLRHEVSDDITSIGLKFNMRKGLESIDFCGSQVEELEDYAFDCCYDLESVYLNGCLKKIGYAVFRDTQISELVIPNSVTEIDKEAFIGCNNLQSITLPEMFKDRVNEFLIDSFDTPLVDKEGGIEINFH